MKMIKAFLVAAVVVVALCVEAATWTDPETGIRWTYTVIDGQAYIGNGTSAAISTSTKGEVVVPSKIGEYQVVGLLDKAFLKCSSLTSVILPNGIPKISDSTFENCNSLTSVAIPDSVKHIGISAFQGCSALKSITIPNSVEVLWSSAFYGCTSLMNITIPNSVTRIDSRAFYNCRALIDITIPDSVLAIGNAAFSGCTGLADGDGFVIVRGVLYGCKGGDAIIPNSAINISESAFERNALLTSVAFHAGITNIPSRVCYYCSSLTNVIIQASAVSIGEEAFSGCRALSSVSIHSIDLRVKDNSFSSCKPLNVTVPGWKCGIDFSSVTNLVVANGAKDIRESAFNGCSSLRSVTIPNSVIRIGRNAFSNCSYEIYNRKSLQGLVLVDGWIVDYESLQFGALELNGVRGVGDQVFSNCSSLTSVSIGDGMIGIGDYAFSNCSSLMSVSIPNSVTYIGANAFYGCSDGFYIIVANENKRYKMIDGQVVDTVDGVVFFSPKVGVEVISTSIREDDPTILDVTYVVRGGYDKVNVRALAFEDGTRSWAKVVRPETFVATPSGETSVIGDDVRVNVTNTFSWKVSVDYLNNLAKLKLEIFVQTDDLLPLDLMTIPAYNGKPALEFSRNTLTESDVMNALYWLYADKDSGLNLSSGILKNENITLVQSTSLNSQDAAKYVIQKMGYTCLTGENLNYINSETRLNLTPSGIRQYAVKEVE